MKIVGREQNVSSGGEPIGMRLRRGAQLIESVVRLELDARASIDVGGRQDGRHVVDQTRGAIVAIGDRNADLAQILMSLAKEILSK